jgi:outer membrane lipopolysaccharide assembly protein LptE/RlpB
MRHRLLVPLLAVLSTLSACAPALIPNTEIPETADTRAIYDLIRSYGEALARKDVGALLMVVSPDYYDNAGTPDPADDVTRATLEKGLAADLARIDSMRIEIGVKKIELNGNDARAEVFYDATFRVLIPNGSVAKRPSDIHEMRFRKKDNTWKITSGL